MSRANVLAAMAARIEQRKWFRITAMGAANDERFDGTVAETGFNLTRIMGYRNSFAPVIEGEVSEGGSLSRVMVTMRPSIFVAIFLAFFFTIFFSVFLGVGGEVLWLALAAPLLM
jgi:hypothetical protein